MEDFNKGEMELSKGNRGSKSYRFNPPTLLILNVMFSEVWGDWMVTDTNYEPGWPMGTGKTREEAIKEYKENAQEFYGGTLIFRGADLSEI